MENLVPALMLVIGLLIGGIAAWLIFRPKLKHEYERARADSETERATLLERLAGKENQLGELRAAVDKETADSERLTEQLRFESEKRSAAEAKLREDERATRELSNRFESLAAEALRKNNQSFLQLAKENLERFQESAKGDLESKRQAIDELVGPVKVALDRVDSKLQALEVVRAGAYEGLKQQVSSLIETQQILRLETSNLVRALRTPSARGRWGEIQLRRVIELAGMLEYCDFVEQETVTSDDKRLRPDVIIKLPGGRSIVIDSKVPFEAFYESISTNDEEIRKASLREHSRLVRNHISALSKKSYWEMFQDAPEFVLLFLPGETFYSAALEHDPKLIEDGVAERVIIATPSTLIALLKAVSYGWQQEKMAANVTEVKELGKELYDRLRIFAGHFVKIGAHLGSALNFFNEGVGSFESRVLVTARKLKEKSGVGGDEIETLKPIDRVARTVHFDEGGFFPDSAAEPHAQEEDLPLLNSKSTSAGD